MYRVCYNMLLEPLFDYIEEVKKGPDIYFQVSLSCRGQFSVLFNFSNFSCRVNECNKSLSS